MIKPPRADTARPRYDTPPFVPFGTGDQDRIWSGREVDRIPSSEARVSARHVEKWLSVRLGNEGGGHTRERGRLEVELVYL
jgi:hypothetical protein